MGSDTYLSHSNDSGVLLLQAMWVQRRGSVSRVRIIQQLELLTSI